MTRDAVEHVLAGGIANSGAVVRVGDTVRRPGGDNATLVHRLLAHLQDAGFAGAHQDRR